VSYITFFKTSIIDQVDYDWELSNSLLFSYLFALINSL